MKVKSIGEKILSAFKLVSKNETRKSILIAKCELKIMQLLQAMGHHAQAPNKN